MSMVLECPWCNHGLLTTLPYNTKWGHKKAQKKYIPNVMVEKYKCHTLWVTSLWEGKAFQ